jgi:hypothetical protein
VFCAWQDVFLMSLFFFLSGLFVWPSLERKGARIFLRDRVLRIGVPFTLAVVLLMPLANYPTYLQTAVDPGVPAFWRHWLALPFWPCGPMWFLWLLLVADFVAAGLHEFLPRWGDVLIRFSFSAGARPMRYFAGLVIASALAYVPLAVAFTPSAWLAFGPFGFQLSRPLHYAVYCSPASASGRAASSAVYSRRTVRWCSAGRSGWLRRWGFYSPGCRSLR